MVNRNHPFFTTATLGFTLLGAGIVACLLLKWWGTNPLVFLFMFLLLAMYTLLWLVAFVRVFLDERPVSFAVKCVPPLYGLAWVALLMGLNTLVDNDFGRDIPPAYRMREGCIGSNIQLRSNGTFKKETSAFVFTSINRGTYSYIGDTLKLTEYNGDSSVYVRRYDTGWGYVLQPITDTLHARDAYEEAMMIDWKKIKTNRK
jgi:hypothetical protein